MRTLEEQPTNPTRPKPATNMANVTHQEFAKAFNFSPETRFGPMWEADPAFVLECLGRYLEANGHDNPLLGSWTVNKLAQVFMENPYQPDGEEVRATLCLLRQGKHDAKISRQVSHNLR